MPHHAELDLNYRCWSYGVWLQRLYISWIIWNNLCMTLTVNCKAIPIHLELELQFIWKFRIPIHLRTRFRCRLSSQAQRLLWTTIRVWAIFWVVFSWIVVARVCHNAPMTFAVDESRLWFQDVLGGIVRLRSGGEVSRRMGVCIVLHVGGYGGYVFTQGMVRVLHVACGCGKVYMYVSEESTQIGCHDTKVWWNSGAICSSIFTSLLDCFVFPTTVSNHYDRTPSRSAIPLSTFNSSLYTSISTAHSEFKWNSSQHGVAYMYLVEFKIRIAFHHT